MTANLDEPLKNLARMEHQREGHDGWVYHIANKFQEPMQGGLESNMKTTLVQSADGSWTMVEFCEAMTRLLFVDGPFEERAMRPMITILTRDTVIRASSWRTSWTFTDVKNFEMMVERRLQLFELRLMKRNWNRRKMRKEKEEMIGLEIWLWERLKRRRTRWTRSW